MSEIALDEVQNIGGDFNFDYNDDALTFQNVWDVCKDKRSKINNRLKKADGVVFNKIIDDYNKSVSDEESAFDRMYRLMNGIGQSARSGEGYNFQDSLCLALQVWAKNRTGDDEVLFANEVSFENFSKIAGQFYGCKNVVLNTKETKERRVDIVGFSPHSLIIISCKGGFNNTDTEDDVIRTYASTINEKGMSKLRTTSNYCYILATRSNYKSGRTYLQVSEASNRPEHSDIADIIDMLNVMTDRNYLTSNLNVDLNEVRRTYNLSTNESSFRTIQQKRNVQNGTQLYKRRISEDIAKTDISKFLKNEDMSSFPLDVDDSKKIICFKALTNLWSYYLSIYKELTEAGTDMSGKAWTTINTINHNIIQIYKAMHNPKYMDLMTKLSNLTNVKSSDVKISAKQSEKAEEIKTAMEKILEDSSNKNNPKTLIMPKRNVEIFKPIYEDIKTILGDRLYDEIQRVDSKVDKVSLLKKNESKLKKLIKEMNKYIITNEIQSEEIEKLEEDREHLRKEKGQFKTKREKLNEKIKLLEDELDEFKDKVKSYEDKIATIRSDIKFSYNDGTWWVSNDISTYGIKMMKSDTTKMYGNKSNEKAWENINSFIKTEKQLNVVNDWLKKNGITKPSSIEKEVLDEAGANKSVERLNDKIEEKKESAKDTKIQIRMAQSKLDKFSEQYNSLNEKVESLSEKINDVRHQISLTTWDNTERDTLYSFLNKQTHEDIDKLAESLLSK